MFSTVRRTVMTIAALAALALGGAVISNAASSKSSTTTTQGGPSPRGYGYPGPPPGAPGGPGPGRPGGGRHVGANGQREQALPADAAAKVKSAAENKVPGGTVERVETDVDTGSPYEAHIRKSDGSQVVAYVNKSFEVTSVASMQHR
jgi:hypothetical protein